MKWLNRFSPKVVRITFTLFALYSLVVGTVWFVDRNFINAAASDDCAWIDELYGDSVRVTIRDIVPGGVADEAGLKDGDILLSIDGKRFETGLQAQVILNTVPDGAQATYVIERAGEKLVVPITIGRQFNFTSLSFYILGLFFTVIGYVVGASKPHERVPQLFFFFAVTSMIFFSARGLRPFPSWEALNTITTSIIFPGAFLHFFFHFPFTKEIVRRRRFFIPLLYTLVILHGAGVGFFNVASPPIRNVLINLYLVYIPIGFGIYLHSYLNVKSPEKRRPLRVVLWGAILGISALLYIILYVAFYRGSSITLVLYPWRSIPIFFVAAIPLSFGYAVVRYRLMDIEIVVKRSLIYGIITASVASIYLGIVFGIGNLFRDVIGQNNPFLMVIAIVIIALIFEPLKQRVQNFVDRRFYRERYSYQKALLEFSRSLPTLIDLKEIMESLTTTILNRMHVKSVAVCLYDGDGTSCTTIMQKGFNGPDIDFRKESGSLIGLLDRNRAPQLLYGVRQDSEFPVSTEDKEKILKAGIVLSVPMFSRDRLIAVLHLGEKESEKPYTEEDTDLLQTVGNQAAIALENARLHLEEIEKRRIEEELAMARRIQQGLLPKESPKISGLDISGISLPATMVGGDYYDFIKLDEHHLLVVVGDVSGKGMSAALYMSKIQGMIQFASRVYSSPKDILVEVNRRIYDGLERKSFITMILALFDLSAKKVTICRAGHNPALIASNGHVSLLRGKGMGLGLEPGSIFGDELEMFEEELEPGKLFFFYSDGLTEAMNENREEFGERRVLEAINNYHSISAETLELNIIEAVTRFRGAAEQNDDVTVVVVKAV